MVIFHGSENIIDKPIYGKVKSNNDYGRGFYCTEDYDLACEWSVDENRNGFVNSYDFSLDGLNVLDLNDGSAPLLSWMAMLLKNREFKVNAPIEVEARKYILDNFLPEYDSYDVIRGYRADDSYFAYAQDFISNTISLEQLSRAMHLGKLGEQIVLKSARAFSQISFRNSEQTDSGIWYPKKEYRDRTARSAYYGIEKKQFNKGEIYMIMILDKELKSDDLRL